MMEQEAKVGTAVFILSWILLIGLTAALLYAGTSSMAPAAKHLWIVLMIGVQAYLVAFYFMHLRFERLPLVLSVVLGVLVTAGMLYLVLAYDGSRIARLKILP